MHGCVNVGCSLSWTATRLLKKPNLEIYVREGRCIEHFRHTNKDNITEEVIIGFQVRLREREKNTRLFPFLAVKYDRCVRESLSATYIFVNHMV